MITVGVCRIRRPRMQVHRNQRQQQSYEICEIMASFREKRKRVRADSRYNKQNDVCCRDEEGDSQHLGGVLLAAMDVHVHGISLKQPSAISRQESLLPPEKRGETSSFIRDNDVDTM